MTFFPRNWDENIKGLSLTFIVSSKASVSVFYFHSAPTFKNLQYISDTGTTHPTSSNHILRLSYHYGAIPMPSDTAKGSPTSQRYDFHLSAMPKSGMWVTNCGVQSKEYSPRAEFPAPNFYQRRVLEPQIHSRRRLLPGNELYFADNHRLSLVYTGVLCCGPK